MLAEVILVLLAYGNCADSKITINKCCPKSWRFDENFKCVKFNKYENNHDWLPKTFNTSFEVKYDTIPCGPSQVKAFDSSYFTVNSDGSITLSDDSDNIIANYGMGSFCLDKYVNEDSEGVLGYLCPCDKHKCIRKCCDQAEYLHRDVNESSHYCRLATNSKLLDWHKKSLTNEESARYYEVFYGFPECGPDEQLLYLIGAYEFLENGSIHSEVDGVIHPINYCGDYISGEVDDEAISKVIACIPLPRMSLKSKIYGSLNIIGVIFLLLTVLVLVYVPTHIVMKQALFMHIFCLMLAYMSSAILQLIPMRLGKYFCIFNGFLMQFTFLAGFFWLNVMCIDMSWTFTGLKVQTNKSQSERKRFLGYSIYAWGCSSVLTLTALIVDFSSVPESSLFKPNMGEVRCWFRDDAPLWIYFFGPIGIILFINLLLFIYTSMRIIILKRGTKALQQPESDQHGSKGNKKRFVLYAKLFLLMGVTWLTEIISTAIGNKNGLEYIWYITDTINLLRAVFIFIIFCCKRKVWSNIKKHHPTMKRCEIFLKRLVCKNDTQGSQDDEKTASTNSTQNDIESKDNNTIEMRQQ